MNNLSQWPALDTLAHLPKKIGSFERAIWGKVHNEVSDFRWIACSVGFKEKDLNRHLFLGAEDEPKEAVCWLIKGRQCFAIKNYPSRATDLSGRGGFLEKQILTWEIPQDFPVALARLILLPFIQQNFNDQIWWETTQQINWADPQFYLEIIADECKDIVIDPMQIQQTIEQGIADIKVNLSEAELVQFYAEILSEISPILLKNLTSPLSAEALAVLFLPLADEETQALSIVNWIPSRRVKFNKLAKTWDIIGIQKEIHPPNLSSITVQQDYLDYAKDKLIPAFLNNEPSQIIEFQFKLEQDEIIFEPLQLTEEQKFRVSELPNTSIKTQKLLKKYAKFFNKENKRWLEREYPITPLRDKKERDEVIRYFKKKEKDLIDSINIIDTKPKNVKVDEKQWNIKVDLLRALAFSLTADASFSKMDTNYISPLYFIPQIEINNLIFFYNKIGEQKLINHIKACYQYYLLQDRAEEIMNKFKEWRENNNREELKPFLANIIDSYDDYKKEDIKTYSF